MDALSTISAQLAALSGAQRLHSLALPGASDLVVERWSGEESLSTHFNYVIDFLSLDAALDLEAGPARDVVYARRQRRGHRTGRAGQRCGPAGQRRWRRTLPHQPAPLDVVSGTWPT